MRRTSLITAAGAALAGLGVLVGLAIGSPGLPAQRDQPVQVRTQVIRRTVNVYRRAKRAPVPALAPKVGRATLAGTVPRTRTSGAAVGSASPSPAAGVVTRTSGVPAGAREGASTPVVRTRTSGAPSSGSGAGRPVSTRTSGGGGDGERRGHDD